MRFYAISCDSMRFYVEHVFYAAVCRSKQFYAILCNSMLRQPQHNIMQGAAVFATPCIA